MRIIRVSLGERSYPIYIGRDLFPLLNQNWTDRIKPCKVLLVSDENVFPLFGASLIKELSKGGFQVFPAIVPPGEESKSLFRAEELYTVAIEAGLDRRSLVVALGGGVVGDLAGFVAATYLRGVPFIQIPTTLLAQVDSSVGGKVAVNHRLGKNLIGAFHQPLLVWIDLKVLDTLPARELLAGTAEVVKYGAILSQSFFDYLEENWPAFLARQAEVLGQVIARCCELKAGVVARDEREEGLRAVLNFGHTLGHALEAATCYAYYLHGEAVLSGMSMATEIALQKKVLDQDNARRLKDFYARIGLVPPPRGLKAKEVYAALKFDKKREGRQNVFVLPVRVGEVRLFNDIQPALILKVLAEHLGEGV